MLLSHCLSHWLSHLQLSRAWLAPVGLSAVGLWLPAMAHATPLALRITVNSNQDLVQPDDVLTLREALELANGSLTRDRLTPAEQSQVQISGDALPTRIEFNLPPAQTTIRLRAALPSLNQAGMILDGTTQPGYAGAAPIVAIAPAPGVAIGRGLTVTGDRITLRGLSLYGFTNKHNDTAALPPADIFVTTQTALWQAMLERDRPAQPPQDALPPKDIVIEHNWLGIPPAAIPTATPVAAAAPPSAFGVAVFYGINTLIQNNRIADHDGSGIITGVTAENLQIRQNILTHNGFAGMPDAIRLEGNINNAQIMNNQIRQNAGSGIYLFKSAGAIQIQNNILQHNGQRYHRAAIYLMGNAHQILGNQIQDQVGPGVVVAAYPPSHQIRIQNNQFSHLQGLSIDLVSQFNTNPQDYQLGDGPNPVTDSRSRQEKSANDGTNAPQFFSREFFLSPSGKTVVVEGLAAPGATVDVYQVKEVGSVQGPLNQPVGSTIATPDGKFSIALELQAGDVVSAIATAPQSGTSEPAINATIRALPTP